MGTRLTCYPQLDSGSWSSNLVVSHQLSRQRKLPSFEEGIRADIFRLEPSIGTKKPIISTMMKPLPFLPYYPRKTMGFAIGINSFS